MRHTNRIDEIQAGLRSMFDGTVRVGPIASADSELLVIAASNEYGATIRPKNGKYLSLPLIPEAKGRSPKSFPGLKFIPPKKTGGSPVLARVIGETVEPVFVLVKEVIIPERAFLRLTAQDQNARKKAASAAAEAIRRFLTGDAPAQSVLDAIGFSLSASVKRQIANGTPPPNAALTLSLKRGTTTLVDEGRLMKSIAHEVVQ
jgi:hypothetical protein